MYLAPCQIINTEEVIIYHKPPSIGSLTFMESTATSSWVVAKIFSISLFLGVFFRYYTKIICLFKSSSRSHHSRDFLLKYVNTNTQLLESYWSSMHQLSKRAHSIPPTVILQPNKYLSKFIHNFEDLNDIQIKFLPVLCII